MPRERNPNNTPALMALGLTHDDAQKLRRLEKRLHRWHELECGVEGPGGMTLCVERDDETNKTYFRRMGWVQGRYFDERSPVRDDEPVMRKRMDSILRGYHDLVPFVQTDPRGCALYIIPLAAVKEAQARGQDASYIYSSRGVAVY